MCQEIGIIAVFLVLLTVTHCTVFVHYHIAFSSSSFKLISYFSGKYKCYTMLGLLYPDVCDDIFVECNDYLQTYAYDLQLIALGQLYGLLFFV